MILTKHKTYEPHANEIILTSNNNDNSKKNIYIYILYIYIYKYICIYIYTNLPANVIARLPHPRSGDRQGQETFLAPFVDNQTCNYDTECSNYHPPINTKFKGIES